MHKLGFLMFAMLCVLGGYLVGGIVKADHVPVSNGDFESGVIYPWLTEATAGGTLGDGYPKISAFDLDGPEGPMLASNAVQFSVGTLPDGSGPAGGTVYQVVHLIPGEYSISADIAVDEHGTVFGVNPGGIFELMMDNVVLDSHNFGQVGPNQTIHKLLSNLHVVTEGDHRIGVRITRTKPPAPSLIQVVDNVVAQLTAAAPASAEPASADPAPAGDPPADDGCSNQGVGKDGGNRKDTKKDANDGSNSDYDNCGKNGNK